MPDVLMATVVKTETRDSVTLYDLEYRASEDDAWYSVCIVLDAVAETLTIKYLCSPEVYEVVFSAGNFETEARLEELVGRFRPVSRQLQDYECWKISVGTTVCAAHGSGDNDLRFYDAVVDAVDHKPHSFAGGEEECLCTFVLFWKHGRGRDTLTSGNIASICFLEPATQIDSRIRAFAKMVKKKITSPNSISALTSLGLASNISLNDKKNSCSSIIKEESPQSRPLELVTSLRLGSLTYKTEAMMSNYNQSTSQDEDMEPRSFSTDGSATTDGHFFILINNLEKDLTPSSIKNFIYEKTTILPEACMSLRHLSDPFARGVIIVDCQKKAQTIHEFLDNANHLVVSSRGRPWVITEKASEGTFGPSVRNLIPQSLEEIKHERTERELEVVVSGTESYKRAKQLKDLIVEFLQHESQVLQRLVLEEKKISRSHPGDP